MRNDQAVLPGLDQSALSVQKPAIRQPGRGRLGFAGTGLTGCGASSGALGSRGATYNGNVFGSERGVTARAHWFDFGLRRHRTPQPADKARAQHVSRTDQSSDPPGDPKHDSISSSDAKTRDRRRSLRGLAACKHRQFFFGEVELTVQENEAVK